MQAHHPHQARYRARRPSSSLLRPADDSAGVELVARQYVRRSGAEAVRELEDLAAMAAAIGDTESADIWREIADVAHSIAVQGGHTH